MESEMTVKEAVEIILKDMLKYLPDRTEEEVCAIYDAIQPYTSGDVEL